MALISIIDDFHPLNDAKLLERADQLKPVLHHKICEPVGGFQLKERYSPEKEEISLHKIHHLQMGKGQNLCLDFGTHLVGYLTLDLSYTGSHPDAPAFLKLKFAETLNELSENSESYNGWISRSWIQEEYIHVDLLPYRLVLPRRYAFRYLKITMMDTSPKYKLVVRHAECMTESSADLELLNRSSLTGDEMLDKIDEVSLRTLANCMQDVFEDGPKRDRRLWMGDLRLQALTNYVSFQNYHLVKRCLYLFAGSRFPDGRICANVFTTPNVAGDDTYLFDYALFFVVCLEEYFQQTRDTEALDDLYNIAMQQVELSLLMCDDDHLVSEQAAGDSFIDWNDDLDKRACAQAVLIYTLRFATRLARHKNDLSQANWLSRQAEDLKAAARKYFWNETERCFVSKGQRAIATQVWMILADVLDQEEAVELMSRSEDFTGYKMTTPYMHHYYIAALLRTGLTEKAKAAMIAYWGSMIKAGADTFWESWDPEDPTASPYGGSVINSYCHAWSCTPAYFIREFFSKK